MKISVALYKGDYNFISKLIRWWTSSKYSHCELFVEENGKAYLIGISNDNGVRIEIKDTINHNKWDFYELKTQDIGVLFNHVKSFYDKTKNKKYDFKNIFLSQIFNRKKHDKNKYTCSEWVSECLDSYYNKAYPKKYHLYSPQSVFEYIIENDLVVKNER